MKQIWLPISSILAGLLIGSAFTFSIPIVFAKYLSIAILAALDSVMGGIRAVLQDTFDGVVMLTGFFTNALLAACLAFLGDQIGVDIYLAATVCFGLRLFSNLGFIRRYFVNKYYVERKGMPKKPKNKRHFGKSALDEVETNVDAIMNDILQANTVIQPTTDEDSSADKDVDEIPLKIKAIEKSKTGDEFIQDFFEEDVLEYTKPKK